MKELKRRKKKFFSEMCFTRFLQETQPLINRELEGGKPCPQIIKDMRKEAWEKWDALDECVQLVNDFDGQQKVMWMHVWERENCDSVDVIWNWGKDGEPPVKIDLGYMERIEKAIPAFDSNGKKLYHVLIEGENKKKTKKVQMMCLEVSLRNNKTGEEKVSHKEPEILPPEADEG